MSWLFRSVCGLVNDNGKAGRSCLAGLMVCLGLATMVTGGGCGNGGGDGSDGGEELVDSEIPGDSVIDSGVEPADSRGEVLDVGDTHGDAIEVLDIQWGKYRKVNEQLEHVNAVADGPVVVDEAEQFREGMGDGVVARHVVATASGAWAVDEVGLVYFDDRGGLGFELLADLGWSDPACAIPDVDDMGIFVCLGNDILHVSVSGEVSVFIESDFMIDDFVICGNGWFLLSGGQLCRWDPGSGGCETVDGASGVLVGGCVEGRLVVGGSGGVFEQVAVGGDLVAAVGWDAGFGEISDIAVGGDFWAVAGSNGVVIFATSGAVAASLSVADGTLPVGGVVSVGLDGELGRWGVGHEIGVTTGLVGSEDVEHFFSERYLPSDGVLDLAFGGSGRWLVVGTGVGVSVLEKLELSGLGAKAEVMFGQLDGKFWRLGGFVSPQVDVGDAWEAEEPAKWDDDNDGQWTQEAVAALCYAYATTHDSRYYSAAKKAVKNMYLLMDVPAIDFQKAGRERGFIARSVVRDDEGEVFSSKAGLSNWHLVEYTDGHSYYWKDDTSSDELTGHFYGWSIYHDLCAETEEEKEEVAGYIVALASTLLLNDFLLLDLDGNPTEHGYWSPERLAIAVDGLDVCLANGNSLDSCADAYFGSAYLNSIEILGFMLAAWHVSGEDRFLEAYETLITEHRYDELAMFDENVLTWTGRGTANYCDHELADLAFLTLLRYEPDEGRRALWIESMVKAFAWEAEERNPLKSLAMASVMDEVPGLDKGFRTLVEYPVDLRMFRVDSSHREDVELDVDDRHGNPQFKEVLPYDEMAMKRWDSNPYGVAGGSDGRYLMAPTFWLLPYWGLVYHGAIVGSGG